MENISSNNKLLIESIIRNKNSSISKISKYLDACIMKDEKHSKKANILSYWLKDYINYLEQEENFDCSKLKQYSRGDIIKVNLGFNIGNEEGGLHYCIVLDKKNAKSYSTLTIVPLTSQKSNSRISNTSVFLGNEIYQALLNKSRILYKQVQAEFSCCKHELKEAKKLPTSTLKETKMQEIFEKINKNRTHLELIEKIKSELSQMKTGSIALINQITTISKQRIYNPKKDHDILSGIKLSNEKLMLIDEKIKKLYVN